MRRFRYRFPAPSAWEAFQIPVEAWNRLVRHVVRNRLLAADVAEIGRAGHAWAVTVERDAADRNWVARVRAGFVNGRPAVASVDVDGVRTAVPLIEEPDIPLGVARPVADVPPWFRERWPFRSGAALTGDLETGVRRIVDSEAAADAADRGGWRRLAATGLWLRTARPRITLDVSADGKPLLVLSGPTGSVAEVVSGSPAGEDGDGEETPGAVEFLRGAADPGVDRVRIATVYFLSPPYAPPDAEVDGTWTPYVAHGLFYNLSHGVRVPRLPDGGLDLATGYRGVGAEIINALVLDLERQDARATALMSGARVEGRFWSV